MVFNLRRYFQALVRHLPWLPLVMLPLAVFLLVTGVRPDRFTVVRRARINSESPVAVTTSPVETITLRSLAAVPEKFFADRLALVGWRRAAETDPALSRYDFRDPQALRAVIAALSLRLSPPDSCELSYYGPDPVLGEKLVSFYMDRLLSRLRAGFYRQAAAAGKRNGGEPPVTLQLARTELQRLEHRAWWRSDRLAGALVAALVPLVVFLLVVGLREFLDPSFKSGRQAARYLDLPILGFIPALDPIIRNLEQGERYRRRAATSGKE